MKKYLIILLAFFAFSCSEQKKGRGIDFEKVKSSLGLSADQLEKFDAINAEFDADRAAKIEALKASGKMSKAKYIKIVKPSYVAQEQKVKPILTATQFEVYHEYVKRYMPFQSDYSDELKQEVITELSLDEQQAKMYNAVNEAFVKAYRDAHDYYHGNGEAAAEYWQQFDNNRKEALQKVFTKEQYAQYLELIKKENYRGKNEKG
ncbi:hypothetical protein [Flammeovirga kamogawensis]|uniref:DUF3826 domain-containing protein n=1 Tax=Flammeovirga kamogawensis TaxID=373891 RepID=A0ABX8H121_9BACT|nr:hypothetical protein [Flammeovirga kamogawensis]MBB6463264.1 hypothetical protein [Flammeovirga kamogawensis]QWG09586.1 hypothetical protein KM029_23545 [Flammeovirga kamogawensis]TRX65101.1 hypothetical protein EO216_21445 [Flammeovirga kamogawensis]